MEIEFYKWLHLVGLAFLVMAFGALIFRASAGVDSMALPKRFLSIVHGLGLLFLLVGGFGMLARLGIHGDWRCGCGSNLLFGLCLAE